MNPLKPFEIPLSGVNLIEASAGTGKTYNITSLYVRTLIEKPVATDQVLVMTFTKAATKELKDRLLKRLRDSIYALKTGDHKDDSFLKELLRSVKEKKKAIRALRQAIHSFDEAAVFTIHGFCQQVLRQHAFESGARYDSELISDESDIILELIEDYWRNWMAAVSDDSSKKALLKFMTEKGYNPARLAEETGNISRFLDKKIIPQKKGDEYWNQALKTLETQFHELQRIWKNEKEVITAGLNYEHLNGNTYRKKSIPLWIEQMDDLLDGSVAPVILFDKFEKFTQSHLDDNLTQKATTRVTHPFFETAERYQSAAKAFAGYPIAFKLSLLSYLQKELPVKKEKMGVLSYSDQLTKLRKALRGDEGQKLAGLLRRKYPVALVDEYQDTDPVQYDIFRTIYRNADNNISFFMIGDPKQSIYGFRGADIFSYLKARSDVSQENIFGLEANYRSVPELIDAHNIFWSSVKNPFVLKGITFSEVTAGKEAGEYKTLTERGKRYPPVHFRKLSEPAEKKPKSKGEAKYEAADDTAKEIQRLLRGGRAEYIKIGSNAITGKDIAVLVRTHEQAGLIREALQKRDIKSVQYSDRSVFDSEEAEQMVYLLRAMISPGNERFIKTALATPMLGYTPQELVEIEHQPGKWIEILGLFAELRETWDQKGFAAMFGKFMQKTGVEERLARLVNGERRLTNVLHLTELLQREEQQRDGRRRLLRWMTHKLKDKRKSDDEEQLRLESDEKLVKIVTTHSSKGLEFPIVFCPYLWHGPNISDKGQILEYHKDGQAIADFGGKDDEKRSKKRKMARREQLAEDMRLAYVAMTRAHHRCYLTWCYANSCEFSSLGTLFYGAETSIAALYDTIKKDFDALGNKDADTAINTLCDEHPALFTCQPVSGNDNGTSDLSEPLADRLKPPRTFNRLTPLPAGEAVSSFSSLIRTPVSDPDTPDYDQFLFEDEDEAEKAVHKDNIFGFPKGAGPGTCLHKIFEEITFSDDQTFGRAVDENLSLHNINKKWKTVVVQMLKTTVEKKLLETEDHLTLAAVQPRRLIREMEFYYTSEEVETNELFSIIRENGSSKTLYKHKAAKGFLKGFIDLTFEFNGRFYLLDYKSNYLGDVIEAYDNQSLRDEMMLSAYDLQYHIYTVALHRYLQTRLPGYSYKKHFGGVFYLFLRGINDENKNGIFFDCPQAEVIQKLNNYLLKGVSDE